MSKGNLLSFATIDNDKKSLDNLKRRFRKVADNTSKIVYVYGYPKSKSRTLYYTSDKGTHESKGLAVRAIPGTKRPIAREFGRAFLPGENPELLWGVRMEGNKNPYSKSFKTKEEAVSFAKEIMNKRHGSMISVVEKNGNVLLMKGK